MSSTMSPKRLAMGLSSRGPVRWPVPREEPESEHGGSLAQANKENA
jgi:hypothetical protein